MNLPKNDGRPNNAIDNAANLLLHLFKADINAPDTARIQVVVPPTATGGVYLYKFEITYNGKVFTRDATISVCSGDRRTTR